MIRRRPALLATALACTVFSAPVCRASQSPSAPTPPAYTDSEASQAAPADANVSSAVPAAHAVRHYHRRKPSRHASARSLPSRGSGDASSASVVGRLGMVISDKAVISAGREAAGRVLSVCPKGQPLALCGQTSTQYAVLMVDHSLGFVAKSDVQILDSQVVANTPDGNPDPATAADPATGGPLGQGLVQTAFGYLGVPYVWGGNTAAGIDCSGFVKAVYAAHGITLPRHSGDQATVGYDVPKNDWSRWVPGDRMYFACHHAEIDHTGMYIGEGRFIHSSMGHGQSVAIDRVDGAYYAEHLVCVRRSRELVADAPAPSDAAPPAPAADDSENSQR